MTGLHTGHGRIRGNGELPLEDGDVTMAEVFRARGYRTALVGKWGLGYEGTPGLPERQGFDETFGYLTHQQPHRQYTDRLWKNGAWIDVSPTRDFTSDLFTQAAVDFIDRSRDHSRSSCISRTRCHTPNCARPRTPSRRSVGRFPETPFVNAKADATTPVPPYTTSGGYRSQPTPHAAFAGMVTRMDQGVGRVLDALRQRGLDRDTIVIFTSDNGPHKEGGADPEFFDSNGPLRGIKRDLYEGGIRVPMLVRWPGTVPAGRVNETVWAHWDMLPTLATPGRRHARRRDSMACRCARRCCPRRRPPVRSGRSTGSSTRAATNAPRAAASGRPSGSTPTQPIELYDLDADIGETHNLAATQPAIVKQFETFFATARTPSERWPGRNA